MKLNLGCRNRAIEGFDGMDLEYHPGVVHIGDVSDLSRFKAQSVHEIYSSHILEHFPHTQTLKVLKEWHRVLVPKGILYLAVPDFKRAVELYGKFGMSNDWVERFLMGDQIYPSAFHYALFDEWKLTRLLEAAGFSEVSRVVDFGLNKEDCSGNVSNYDHKSVSLNLIAVN